MYGSVSEDKSVRSVMTYASGAARSEDGYALRCDEGSCRGGSKCRMRCKLENVVGVRGDDGKAIQFLIRRVVGGCKKGVRSAKREV